MSKPSPSPAPPKHAELLSAALALARLGLRPVPMITEAKRPALKGWREAAATDPEALSTLFARATRADGLAIATGGGVFVIDLDRGAGIDGVLSFAALVRQHDGGMVKGPRVRTPRRGVHLYFASPPAVVVANRVALAPGVDVRGDGGLAMAPPSCGPAGPYRWAPAPFDLPIPPAPAWLIALVAARPPPPKAFTPIPWRAPTSYLQAALNAELNAVASARVGTRNASLFKAAARLGELAAGAGLSIDLLVAGLLQAADACGLVRDNGAVAVEATIASGLRRGLANPRTPQSHRR